MVALNQDLTVDSGDPLHAGKFRILEITVDNGANPPVVVDIDTAAITWALSDYAAKQPGKAATAILSKTVGDGITISDGPNGVFQVQLDPADTLALEGRYYHEAEIDIASKPTVVVQGLVDILRSITN